MPAADLTPYYQPNASTSDGTKFDNALAYIQTILNGLDDSNISSLSSSKITGGGVVPTGALMEYAAAASPTGWLLCDGSAVSRATYSALFAVVGTTYGVGDGSTTFNLPDFRGRVAVGYAASGGHADVSTLGANDGVAAANRRAKHRHTPHTHGTSSAFPSYTGGGAAAFPANPGAVNVNTNAISSADGGSGNANDSLDAPAYIVVNRIIKT